MNAELTALTLAALLQVVQFVLMAVPANIELGLGKTISPRDPDRLGGSLDTFMSAKTGRLYRAFINNFEALILFTIASLVITLSGQSTLFTAICAYTFVAARILYVPCYAFGLTPWRSVVWSVGFGATTLMLLAALI